MATDNHVDVMPEANKTYENFRSLLRYSIPPILVITAFVVWLIA